MSMNSRWLLIHGGWGGSWQWQPLLEKLEKSGSTIFAPDLPGMGNTTGTDIDLSHFISCCSDYINEDERPVNMVCFSFGGMTATALAGIHKEKIKNLIYIDAFVPQPGQAFSHIAGDKITGQIKTYCEVMSEGDMIPPFLQDDDRYRPHPLNTLFTEVHYQEGHLEELNPLYIECTDKNPRWTFTPLLEEMASSIKERGWDLAKIHSDHMPMYSHTEELFQILRTATSLNL